MYPLSWLHGLVLKVRHMLYDKNVIPSKSFDIPIIKVGNLNLGGTGKTPHAEYLVELLKEDYDLAVLSRGYRRKSKGFLLADKDSTTDDLGDEACQIHKKFPEIRVAVDKNRSEGIAKLLDMGVDVVVLDDTLQHRPLAGGLSIMMMDFSRPIDSDSLWPAGSLRDVKSRSLSMDIIVVGKCPSDLTKVEQLRIVKNLMPRVTQKVFFTSYEYLPAIHVFTGELLNQEESEVHHLDKDNILVFSGIADDAQLVEDVNKFGNNVVVKKFADHHDYSHDDVFMLIKIFDSFASGENILLTTEKDAVKLMAMDVPNEFKLLPIYYLPIRVNFLGREKEFNTLITSYVKKNQRNR